MSKQEEIYQGRQGSRLSREHIRSWQSLFECTQLFVRSYEQRELWDSHAEGGVETGKLGGWGLKDVPGRSVCTTVLAVT